MFIKECINQNDSRKSEIREGVSGSGKPVFQVQWDTGWIDFGFKTVEEAENWAVAS